MNLPDLIIPQVPFIKNLIIPNFSHPLIVHFAVALPVVIILLEFINLFARRKLIGSISFFFMILFSLSLFLAYLSGNVDAKILKDSLNTSGNSIFKQHRLEGIYIVYGSLVLLVIKFLSSLVRKIGSKILFLLSLIIFTAILGNVALKGTKLVYKYGVLCPIVYESKKSSIKKEENLTKIPPKETLKKDQNSTL